MTIKNENEFKEYKIQVEELLPKITKYEDENLIPRDKLEEYTRLSKAIAEWEAAYHPLPGYVSSLITDAIKKKMKEEDLKQKETAKVLGISESRISDLLNGRRPLNLNLVKKLRDNLGISADFILDHI